MNLNVNNVVPIGAPRNLNATFPDARSFELRWDPPTETLQYGLIRQYGVTIVSLDTQSTMTLATNDSSSRLLVDGLHPFYTYKCFVLAITVGPGPTANVTLVLPEDG